jgi:hypothetical protein
MNKMEYQLCSTIVIVWNHCSEVSLLSLGKWSILVHVIRKLHNSWTVSKLFLIYLQLIMVLIYWVHFYIYIIGVQCMEAICRIKFHIKHLLVYVEHITLDFFHFTTCILRGLGTLLLALYFFMNIDCKFMSFMFVTHIYKPLNLMIRSHIWIFHDKVTKKNVN